MKILTAIAISALMICPAIAQQNQPLKQIKIGIGGGPLTKLANSPAVSFFSKWSSEDINAAIELSTSIKDLPDDVGKACWQTFAAMGNIIRQHPIPATLNLATDIEAIRLFNMAIKKVCLKPECSQVWNDIQNQVAALMPISVPISLASICAKIP